MRLTRPHTGVCAHPAETRVGPSGSWFPYPRTLRQRIRRLATAIGHLPQPEIPFLQRRKNDRAFATPRPAFERCRCVAQEGGRTTRYVHLHDLAAGKEADEPAVGRPEQRRIAVIALVGDDFLQTVA